MVKILFAFILFLSAQSSFAGFYAGIQSNSWQDAIPVAYTNTVTKQKVSFYALTTFTSLSAGGGYEGSIWTRWRYAADVYVHSGTADILKLEGSPSSPRKNFVSEWLDLKFDYRFSKTFSVGPQLVVNSVNVGGAGNSTSLGFLINTEVEMYENLRFIQNFGSMNDSGTVAYSIGIQKYF
ncbi:MAG: hypothetical protein ACXVAX_07685 [Pseudobdellovibrio sp.]